MVDITHPNFWSQYHLPGYFWMPERICSPWEGSMSTMMIYPLHMAPQYVPHGIWLDLFIQQIGLPCLGWINSTVLRQSCLLRLATFGYCVACRITILNAIISSLALMNNGTVWRTTKWDLPSSFPWGHRDFILQIHGTSPQVLYHFWAVLCFSMEYSNGNIDGDWGNLRRGLSATSPISEKGNHQKFLTTLLGRQFRHILQDNTHVALQRHKFEALPTADLPKSCRWAPVVEIFLETAYPKRFPFNVWCLS